jgi:hypothetical protein
MFTVYFLLPFFFSGVGNGFDDSTLHEQVDLIEFNHFHDDRGRRVYDQVIFYEWSTARGCYLVRSWCLVEKSDYLDRVPQLDFRTDLWTVRIYDNDKDIQRRITSKHCRETWTQTDPERRNRKVLNEKLRQSFVKIPRESPRAPAIPANNVAINR